MSQTLSSAWPNCSLVYWKVREAKGVICPPKELVNGHVSHPYSTLVVQLIEIRRCRPGCGASYVRLFWKPLKASILISWGRATCDRALEGVRGEGCVLATKLGLSSMRSFVMQMQRPLQVLGGAKPLAHSS